MKNVRAVLTVSIVFVCVSFLTVGADEPAPPLTLEQLEAIAIQPAKHHEATKSRVVPEMLPLFKEEEITYTGKTRYENEKLRFRLHVPENMEPDKKYPLILWLHGTGEAGTDNQAQLIHLHHVITYLTGPKKRDFFLLVPQTPKNHTAWDAYFGYRYVPVKKAENENTEEPKAEEKKEENGKRVSWLGNVLGVRPRRTMTINNVEEEYEIVEEPREAFEDSPLGFSFAMLDYVMEKYPVDENRVTVSGLSSGGDGTWRALERRPEQFAAAVPLVSWRALKADAIDKNPLLKKIPIWAIYSSDDNGIEEARKDFERVEEAGCNVKKSEFGVCGHNAWTPAMLQADIFSYLLSRGKKDGEYVAVVDASVNPDDMKGVIEVATRDPRLPTLAAETTDSPKPQATEPEMQPATTIATRSTAVPTPPGGMIAQMSRPLNTSETTVQMITRRAPGRSAAAGIRSLSEKERLYCELAGKYFAAGAMEDFTRIYSMLPPDGKMQLLGSVLRNAREMSTLRMIEQLIAELPDEETTTTITVISEAKPEPKPEPEENAEPIPGAKIVEECDRPWAMTSESLYGMFPADWDREAKKVSDFIVTSTTQELHRTLIDSLKGDQKRFEEACQSVLRLENKPMSSPWFETSGGRLRSDIKYTLSAKGRMFVRLLQRDAGKLEISGKTLQKIQLILGVDAF